MAYAGPLTAMGHAAPVPIPEVEGASKSSGLLTADGVVLARPGVITAVSYKADGAGSMILYDNASAASGNELVKLEAGAAADTMFVHFDTPVKAENGIYLDVTGTTPEVIVYYK